MEVDMTILFRHKIQVKIPVEVGVAMAILLRQEALVVWVTQARDQLVLTMAILQTMR